VHLFKGIECDILPDGRLDYDDELLASFDYVVASVHSHFQQTAEEMTARIIRALKHPAVTMLGHATGDCCSAAKATASISTRSSALPPSMAR
jgi:DNA polymerase (family 10)